MTLESSIIGCPSNISELNSGGIFFMRYLNFHPFISFIVLICVALTKWIMLMLWTCTLDINMLCVILIAISLICASGELNPITITTPNPADLIMIDATQGSSSLEGLLKLWSNYCSWMDWRSITNCTSLELDITIKIIILQWTFYKNNFFSRITSFDSKKKRL